MKIYLFFAAFLLLGSAKPLWAQIHKTKTVSVDIGGRVLAAGTNSSGIPFDEAFALTGSATGVERIELTYRIDPKQSDYKRYYGIDAKANTTKYSITTPVAGFQLVEKDDSLYLEIRENKFKYFGSKDPNVNIQSTDGKTTTITYTYKDYKVIPTDKPEISCSRIESHRYYPDVSKIGADGYTRDAEVWNRPDDATTTFSLNAGPLHDNLTYNFRFKVFLKTNVGDKQEELSNKIVNLLKNQLKFETINQRTGTNDIALGQTVNEIIKTYTDKRGELVMANQKDFVIYVDQPPFDVLRDQVFRASTRATAIQGVKTEAKTRLIDEVGAFLPGSPAAPSIYDGFKAHILKIGSTATLKPAAQKVWDGDVPGFSCKVKDIGTIVANGDELLGVIKGLKKIQSNGALTNIGTNIADPASVKALWYFCQEISGNDMMAVITPDKALTSLFRTSGFNRFYNYMETLAAASAEGDIETVKQIALEMETAIPGLLNNPAAQIKAKILSVVSQQNLSEPTKKLLDQPLNASIASYKTMKVNDALILLYNGYNNPAIFSAILNGTGKIGGTFQNVEPTADGQVNIPSLQILIDVFSLLNSPAFLDNSGNLIFPESTMHAGMIAHRLAYYHAKLDAISPEVVDYTAFKEQFARLMADTYIKKTYLLSGASMVDQYVEAAKNPYVGVDVGFGYAFTSRTMFVHEGLNIYLRPVNRDAPISSLKGCDYWLKTISLFIGLTQNISSSDVNDKFSNLFNEGSFKTSLLFGAGWRFSTLARLNVAGLIYREKSLNPLVSSTQVKVSPSVTLSIDLSIAKLFKSISSIF